MKIKMLATVPASLDGIHSEVFEKDSVRTLPDNDVGADLARNLITGGLAELVDEPDQIDLLGADEGARRAAVEIPEKWEDFNADDAKDLALKLGTEAKTKKDAFAAIEAELERRAALAAQ